MNEPVNIFSLIASLAVYSACFAAPVAGLAMAVYFFLSQPLRRRERARLFLDLIETAAMRGEAIEPMLISVSQCRDRSPGIRFHLLASHLEKGLRLGDALEKVPRLLPPEIAAMLKAGERVGDIRKVMPACRQFLNDSVSQVRGALNYLLVLAFVLTPFTLFVPMMLNIFVFPKFREVFAGMLDGNPMPPFAVFILKPNGKLFFVEAGSCGLIWAAMIAYVGGPRFRGWVKRILPGTADLILYALPWRKKRLQRDFSTILAVLLDSEMPEPEAVVLAAETTANTIVRRRAARVAEQLRRGVKLSAAIREMDDSGELQWRLANALQNGRGFLSALAGWHEALDAKAFQLEQSAAQITTSALVLINGIVVGCVVAAVFLTLTHLIMETALW